MLHTPFGVVTYRTRMFGEKHADLLTRGLAGGGATTARVTDVEIEADHTGQLQDDFRRRTADSEPERGPSAPSSEIGESMNSLPNYRSTVDVGDLVAIAGQIGLADGRLVDGGAAGQTDQALANLLTVLDAAGLAVTDVVKVNIYLTTMDDFSTFNERYNTVFRTEPPARTCVAVHELPFGALVELEAWARRR